MVQSKNSEHCHQISQIPNGSDTNFQLKTKNLNFWTKLINQKMVFLI